MLLVSWPAASDHTCRRLLIRGKEGINKRSFAMVTVTFIHGNKLPVPVDLTKCDLTVTQHQGDTLLRPH